jgi:hypothetical protein
MKRSKRWPRARRARVGVAAAVAAIGAMAFGGSSAQAATQPLHATFDDAALNVGAVFDILDPPSVATIGVAQGTSTFDTTTHHINVPVNDFVFPPSTGEVTSGVTATVNFGPTAPITGTLDPTTGTLTTDSSQYLASVSLNNAPPCIYRANLVFTTDDTNGAPWQGTPFTVGAPDTTLTHGAIQSSWPDHYWAADAGNTNCSIIDGLISIPGGVAFANGLPDMTPATQEPPASTPAAPAPKKKCKKPKKSSAQSAKKKCKKKK